MSADERTFPPVSPTTRGHQPVLYQAIIHALRPIGGGFYVDGTLGAGGHAWGILEASGPDGQLLGLDRDPQALELAGERLRQFGGRAIVRQASYTSLSKQLAELGWPGVQGILLDLGVSSMQLDTRERGFSFLAEGPLDMRFDPTGGVTAGDLVNGLPEAELAELLFRYGEEPQARRVAAAIVGGRPVETTSRLAAIVAEAKLSAKGLRQRSGRTGLHPATLVFQALRIAVNGELEALEAVLPQALRALAPGGRLAIIAFHSLEDRMVKQFFRRESQDCLCPPRQPVCTCGHRAGLVEVNRRPVQAEAAEIAKNPRARSARLRVAERLGRQAGT